MNGIKAVDLEVPKVVNEPGRRIEADPLSGSPVTVQEGNRRRPGGQ
jgi:hypothetical protein